MGRTIKIAVVFTQHGVGLVRSASGGLTETGMNWTSIATCLGISVQTLYRRRMEFGVENNFTGITDEELDIEVQQTLNLTPYSEETYVRGSLKGRGINVQRFRVRESLKRIDGIGRAVRRRCDFGSYQASRITMELEQ